MSEQSTQELRHELRTAKRFFKPDWDRRMAAAKELGDRKATEAVDDLSSAVRETENPELRQSAVHALGQIGDQQAVTELIGFWGWADAGLRGTVNQTLMQLDANQTAVPLIEALGQRSKAVRPQAETMLRQIKGATPYLVAALAHENSLVQEAAKALLISKGAQAVPDLIVALEQDSAQVREGASQVLGAIGAPAVDALIQCLENENEHVRSAADRLLIEQGDAIAPRLIESLPENPRIAPLLIEMGQDAVNPILSAAKDNPDVMDLLPEMGEQVVGTLFWKLGSADPPVRDRIIDIMCQAEEKDRPGLALSLYKNWFPVLIPYTQTDLVSRLFVGKGTYQEQACLTDMQEEFESLGVGMGARDREGKLINVEDPKMAVSQLEAISTIWPEFGSPSYWAGQWHFLRLEDIGSAIRTFERAAQCNEFYDGPKQAKSNWWLGVCYGRSSPHFDFQKSMECMMKAIDLGWDDKLVYQAMQDSAVTLINLCLTQDGLSQLYLTAVQWKSTALKGWIERDPENQELKQYYARDYEVVKQIEALYAQLGEEAAFAHIKASMR